MNHLYLDCLLLSDSNSRYLKCLVDTGFDGDLVISQKLAQSLRVIPIAGKASKTILGDGKAVFNRLANVSLQLPEVNTEHVYNVVAMIIDQDIDCILGTNLIERICRSNKSNLLINYMTNSIDFVGMR